MPSSSSSSSCSSSSCRSSSSCSSSSSCRSSSSSCRSSSSSSSSSSCQLHTEFDSYKIPVINDIKPQIVDLGWYALIKFDASDAAPNYIGLHPNVGANDGDNGWKIYKYTYSGTDVTVIQLAYGKWSSRTGLF